ncbi:TPA: hypothetical protein KON86_003917 [Clostridioides difficile]|nr:glycine rich domain-containing protein [Clostridioides difficile]HBF0842754.1 hypothetical protein [Clostridioides difficile]HBF4444254.1 hypothetical protein [Clostridioides difficile]
MATVYEFNYTGSEQSVTLKPGKYKLECWGASGGKEGLDFGGGAKGGYSVGELTLKKQTVLFVYVGGCGKSSPTSEPEFNGGGLGSSVSGGGATDIRLVDGVWNSTKGLHSRIIVAGGGGSSTLNNGEGGNGGGQLGSNGNSYKDYYSPGAGQYDGCRGQNFYNDSYFGVGGTYTAGYMHSCKYGGGGGWYGGAGSPLICGGGGGSGYVLTKNSHKPKNYTPTSEYYLENTNLINGGSDLNTDGYAKITLLQALPFLNISSYNSTQVTFKANHTDPKLLTKIEVFIDDTLKETITTDLILEKTINYTLEDNALHTLKIVVTDSSNATAEKIVSLSKNIMPLVDDASLQDIASKISEMKDGLKSGKRSIVNVLTLKDIDASLNNTFVELSEKVKDYFDNADYFFQEANKGKELIATTIGSPATKENTYQELSSYITEFKNTIGTLTTQLESVNNKLSDPYIAKVNSKGTPNTFTVDFRMYHPSSSFTRRSTCIYVDVTFIRYTTAGDMSTGVYKNVKYIKTDIKDLNSYEIFSDGRGTLSLIYDSDSVRVRIQGGYTNSPSRKMSDVYSYNIRMVNTYWD